MIIYTCFNLKMRLFFLHLGEKIAFVFFFVQFSLFCVGGVNFYLFFLDILEIQIPFRFIKGTKTGNDFYLKVIINTWNV